MLQKLPPLHHILAKRPWPVVAVILAIALVMIWRMAEWGMIWSLTSGKLSSDLPRWLVQPIKYPQIYGAGMVAGVFAGALIVMLMTMLLPWRIGEKIHGVNFLFAVSGAIWIVCLIPGPLARNTLPADRYDFPDVKTLMENPPPAEVDPKASYLSYLERDKRPREAFVHGFFKTALAAFVMTLLLYRWAFVVPWLIAITICLAGFPLVGGALMGLGSDTGIAGTILNSMRMFPVWMLMGFFFAIFRLPQLMGEAPSNSEVDFYYEFPRAFMIGAIVTMAFSAVVIFIVAIMEAIIAESFAPLMGVLVVGLKGIFWGGLVAMIVAETPLMKLGRRGEIAQGWLVAGILFAPVALLMRASGDPYAMFLWIAVALGGMAVAFDAGYREWGSKQVGSGGRD